MSDQSLLEKVLVLRRQIHGHRQPSTLPAFGRRVPIQISGDDFLGERQRLDLAVDTIFHARECTFLTFRLGQRKPLDVGATELDLASGSCQNVVPCVEDLILRSGGLDQHLDEHRNDAGKQSTHSLDYHPLLTRGPWRGGGGSFKAL